MIKTKLLRDDYEEAVNTLGIHYYQLRRNLDQVINDFIASSNISRNDLVDIKFSNYAVDKYIIRAALVIYSDETIEGNDLLKEAK